jgi:hypothetical protein
MTAPVLQIIEYDNRINVWTITPVLNGVKSDQDYYFSDFGNAMEFIQFYRRSPVSAIFAMLRMSHLNALYTNTLDY